MRAGPLVAGSLLALAALFLGAAGVTTAAAAQAVDLELAFVVDASGSIDEEETQLQRQGYADALANARVLDIVTSGYHRAIAVAYIEFAGYGCEKLTVPWTRIAGADDAKAFAARILAAGTMFCPGGNAVGDALAFAAESIEANTFQGARRVIDISGDGPNTLGRDVAPTRDAIVRGGITINGLVIERPIYPDLEGYFRRAVTGGPGSFVVKAEDRATFGEAILKKLILEVADRTP